jgi:hypothetical protein
VSVTVGVQVAVGVGEGVRVGVLVGVGVRVGVLVQVGVVGPQAETVFVTEFDRLPLD